MAKTDPKELFENLKEARAKSIARLEEILVTVRNYYKEIDTLNAEKIELEKQIAYMNGQLTILGSLLGPEPEETPAPAEEMAYTEEDDADTTEE